MFTDLLVKLDNSTRWNSTYESLKRALAIKPRIQQYFYDNERELRDDRLSEEDWDFLQEVCNALIIFEQATRRLEGNAEYGSWGGAWEVLPVMEALQRKLVEGQRKWQPEIQPPAAQGPANRRRGPVAAQPATDTLHPMAASYQSAWEKHQKWYTAPDDAQEIYAAAVLLHPSYLAAYFRKHWVGDELEAWIEPTIDRIKLKWKNEYKHLDEHNAEEEEEESQPQPTRRRRPQREPDFIDEFLEEDLNPDAVLQDPFDCYIYGDRMGKFSKKEDLFRWWKDGKHSRSIRQFALDLLSIPAMSAEMERVFSSAKRLITQDRNRLTADMLEVLVLLKYWLDYGIIEPAGAPNEEEEEE